MLKFTDTQVVFEEIPDEITLAVNISNCQNNCIGCHSPYLKEDIGEKLDSDAIDMLLYKNKGITCFCFMGEGNNPNALLRSIMHIKENHKNVKVALYSGRENVEDELWNNLDYIKIGPYLQEYGPLSSKTTNQRLYKIIEGKREDITCRFWKNYI